MELTVLQRTWSQVLVTEDKSLVVTAARAVSPALRLRQDLLEFKASLGQNNTEVKTERKEGREEEGRKERRQL